MRGGNQRKDVFAAAATCGWKIATKEGGNGYLHAKCGCGKHQFWLHKTPSNPNHYREKVQYIHRKCCPGKQKP